MAVIFLTDWNGYDTGERATFSAAEEARLVAARICAVDAPIPSRPIAGLQVTQTASGPALQGSDGIQYPVSPAVIARKRTGVFTRSVIGRFAAEAHSAADRTTNAQFVLAAPFRAVRIGIPNASTTATMAGIKVCVAPTATVGAAGSDQTIIPSGGAAAFVQATFSGASTGSLSPATAFSSPAATTSANYTVTWTDWINISALDRSDGGVGFALIVRVLIPGTTNQAANTERTIYNTTALDNFADESIVGWRTYRASRRDADAVTNPALFFTAGGGFGAWADSHQPLIVQYASEVPGCQIACFGNSMAEGVGDVAAPYGNTPIHYAANTLHSAALPVEFANFGVGSSNAHNFIAIAEKMLPLVKPTVAVYSVFDVNLSMTAANIAVMHGLTGRFIANCRDSGATPAFFTGVPSTPIGTDGSTQGKTYSASEDALRIALNAVYVAGGYPVADFATPANGGFMGSGQMKLLQAWSKDGLHLNDAGQQACGSILAHSLASFI
jgi:hypothetical protein